MRVALIQSEAGGALPDRGALRFARTLRDAGHDVTFVVPQLQQQACSPESGAMWQAEGFAWIPVSAGHLHPKQESFPKDECLTIARALSGVVAGFDVGWFFEAAWAMPLLRERRFAERKMPVVVLEPAPAEPVPTSLQDINQAYARSYAAQWADFVCTEDQNACVQKAEDLWRKRGRQPAIPSRSPLTSPAVTVCIPYFEAQDFLSSTLASLAQQTSRDFTVIVVDDGSHSEAARTSFEACADQYAGTGWRFLRQTNRSAGAARNHAACEAATEFVLFLDADDIAMPRMVERFLRGALLTGDDCLVAPNYGFVEDPNGPCAMLYDPPGNSLIGSMGDDMHGGSCVFFRREAFLQLGGFTEVRGVGFEDYELHVRANLAGLRWDVLPEFVYRYRMPRAGGVSRSTAQYPNQARVLRWYEDRLRPTGLGHLPLAFASVYWKRERAVETLEQMTHVLAPRMAKRAPQGRELKLLLLTCNFPFGFVSGWHTRVQEMIRYFGSRYEVTLMTAMPREQLGPLRKEAFEHLHSVLGVEGSNHTAAVGDEMPHRVQQHYTDVFQEAVRALPTDQYHAVVMDQIFMAEFRKDIDTLPVLTEHNIESRLLRQASERTWHDLGSLPDAYQNPFAEAVRLERYEDRAWSDFPLRAVVSDVDRAQIDRRVHRGRTVVAANGADPASWLPDAKFEAATVLFVGHLAYLPNVDAVELLLSAIWPKVRRERPDARLLIAGRDPSPAVKAAVARASRMGVELIASPRSMADVARRASMTVAPLRLGSGTRCKILESMAWGLPVVSTTLGAEGIEVADGEHVLLRDDPEQFAEATIQLLSDETLWQRFRVASGALVRERYSWDKVFAPLEDALIELIP